jgi:hypothetical protein
MNSEIGERETEWGRESRKLSFIEEDDYEREDALTVDASAPDAELGGAIIQCRGLEYGPIRDGLTWLRAHTYPLIACFFGSAWVA